MRQEFFFDISNLLFLSFLGFAVNAKSEARISKFAKK